MTMGRVEGYMYFYPGMYSMCVTYHDIYDFYYSGHLAFNGVQLYEMIALKRRRPEQKQWQYLCLYLTLLAIYSWVMMTVLRAHYFIDLVGGLAIGFLWAIFSECLSYWPDVKLLGLRKKDRDTLHFSPCPKCGWLNNRASNYVDDSEIIWHKV